MSNTTSNNGTMVEFNGVLIPADVYNMIIGLQAKNNELDAKLQEVTNKTDKRRSTTAIAKLTDGYLVKTYEDGKQVSKQNTITRDVHGVIKLMTEAIEGTDTKRKNYTQPIPADMILGAILDDLQHTDLMEYIAVEYILRIATGLGDLELAYDTFKSLVDDKLDEQNCARIVEDIINEMREGDIHD